MKKTLLFPVMALVVFMALLSCTKKDTPAGPQPTATNTPNATQTTVAGLSFTSFASVPGGTFTQTDGAESFSHTISAFKMGKYEVTYELWYTVYQWAILPAQGYAFADAGREGLSGIDGAAPTAAKYIPVVMINWRNMIVWCNAYSQMAGLTPVYCSDAGYTTPIKDSSNGAYGGSTNTAQGSFDCPYVNWGSNGYRLPTAGEWEYAARYINGSTWTPYNYASGATADYTDATATGLVAWYSVNSGDTIHAVGGRNVNALGIYDMSGNAWECCWDWKTDYPGTSADYRGPATGSERVVRGGSFFNPEPTSYIQTGFRTSDGPNNKGFTQGFRLAKTN
jgi:sulfatase modifying factor 1